MNRFRLVHLSTIYWERNNGYTMCPPAHAPLSLVHFHGEHKISQGCVRESSYGEEIQTELFVFSRPTLVTFLFSQQPVNIAAGC